MNFEQSFYLSLGKYGCYFLCIIDIAREFMKKTYDIETVALTCIQNGYIKFNKENYADSDNFYVENPPAILKMLTKKDWTVTKEGADYKKKEGDYIVQYWHKTGNAEGHFIRENYNGLQHSVSVEQGQLKSVRVFRVE